MFITALGRERSHVGLHTCSPRLRVAVLHQNNNKNTQRAQTSAHAKISSESDLVFESGFSD